MKYQFKINDKVVSAKELYKHNINDYFMCHSEMLDNLLQGKIIELDSFVSENSFDKLQLVEVEKSKELENE